MTQSLRAVLNGTSMACDMNTVWALLHSSRPVMAQGRSRLQRMQSGHGSSSSEDSPSW